MILNGDYLMECSVWMLIGAALLAACVGMLTGIFGIGGGFLTTPALMIFLGVPGAIAVGTDMAMIGFTSSFGIYKRHKSNTIDFKLAAIMATTTSIGVVLGLWILERLKTMPPLVIRGKEQVAAQYILLIVFAFILAIIAVILLLEYRKEPSPVPAKGWFTKISFPPYVGLSSLGKQTIPLIPVLSLGFVVGMLNGLLGIGGGVILLPALIYLVGQKASKAAGTSLMIVWFTTLVGVAGHVKNGNINYYLLAAMMAGGFVGTHYGTVIGLKMHDHKLHFYFSFVVLTAVIMILWKIIYVTF